MEDCTNQIARDGRIQRHTAFNERSQAYIALDDDERASLLLRHLLEREQDLFHHFAPLELPAEPQPSAAPDARQQPPYFGLEHHDQRDSRVWREACQHGAQQLELGPDGNQIHDGQHPDSA